jgi:hypothetical protein
MIESWLKPYFFHVGDFFEPRLPPYSSGVIWFIRILGTLKWAFSHDPLIEISGENNPSNLTFGRADPIISSNLRHDSGL